jgi:uncharacterized protein YndB with AHSA1/START domain
MSNKMSFKVEGQEIIMERVLNAPRELVFQAFREPEHLKQWWGPRGWTLTVCNVDFRPDGVWHYCMKCVDESYTDYYGFESWGKAVYKEIVEPEKLVYIDYFSDAQGNEAEGMPATQVTMIFEEHEGKTKIISRSLYDSPEAVQTVVDMGVEQGIGQTWDRLDEYLQSVQ